MDETTDVLVVGAGPAGSATAALLAEMGHRVLLVDRARFPRSKPCAEYLSPGADQVLARLGVLERVDRLGRKLRGMALHAPNGDCYPVAYRDGGGEPRWSRAVSRTELDAVLLEAARARGARVREGLRVAALDVRDGVAHGATGVQVQDGRRQVTIGARLVVGADGLHSVVVRCLGLRRPVVWPRRLGLVAHVRGAAWPEEYGAMYVGRRGYVGAAPLGEDLVSVGLVMPLPRRGRRLGPPAAALEAALADYPLLECRLASGKLVGVQGVGPLAHAVRACAGPGYLLVGDAAGFFDPFTGEGLYRALRGAELAAAAADRALRADESGIVDVGRQYAEERRHVFQPKERLTRLIQVFVQTPALMDYAVARLRRRPYLGALLGSVLGDLQPAEQAMNARYLWALLRP